MKPTPPHTALRFLRWFCREDYLEEIEGDLTELYEDYHEQSPRKAKLKFIWSVLHYLRPVFIKSFRTNYYVNPITMFRHNLLLTFRNFKRYKSSFFINLIGLSTGLAAVFLIYLWVYDELSFDKFHKNDDQLYQVLRNINKGTEGIGTAETNSDLLAPALIQELGEIEYAVPVATLTNAVLSSDDKKFKSSGKLVGKEFFNVFSFRLVQGNKENVLSDKNSIVLSREMASNFFHAEEHIVGRSITLTDNAYGRTIYEGNYTISGVFDMSNVNSSEQFDFLLTNELFLDKRNPRNIGWHSNSSHVYITVKEGTDVNQFNVNINDFYRSKLEPLYGKEHPEWIGTMFLQRYSDRYLYNRYENGVQSGGRIDYVILFSVIALILLMIACINFINLSTAQASRRLKEVGIKKVIGASRTMLVFQYVGESLLLVFISSLTAVLLVFLLLPQFNLITGKQLYVGWDLNLVMGALTIAFLTGIVSGSYPAFFLSGLRPMRVLKARSKTSIGELLTREGLVIFQFSVSIILIVAVIVITKQIDFVQSKNLGYDKDNILTFEKDGKLFGNHESFLQEVKSISGVVNATVVSGEVSNFSNSGSGFGGEGRVPIQFTFTRVGYDYLETLGIEMREGRNFSREFNNENSKIILNEAAINAMQLHNPLGQIVNIRGEREIIGIVKDFHFKSLHEEIKPMFLLFRPEWTNTVVVKIQSGIERETVAKLESLYHKFNPGVPFEFKFLDEEYQALYTSEQRVVSLSKYFAIMAILISCLGLFGLAAFTTKRRIKEISIRKIFGSSDFGIVRILSGDFTKMVFIAIVAALPLSYFIASKWLGNFAYRIELEWWYFIGAGFMALLIAWFTVGMQTIKAARINPSECLKDE